MNVLMTSAELRRLSVVLAREREKQPAAVFRIWEATFGRYDDARIRLRLAIDEAADDDELASCHDLPFVASREFLDLRGQPIVFYIFTGADGLPEIMEVGV